MCDIQMRWGVRKVNRIFIPREPNAYIYIILMQTYTRARGNFLYTIQPKHLVRHCFILEKKTIVKRWKNHALPGRDSAGSAYFTRSKTMIRILGFILGFMGETVEIQISFVEKTESCESHEQNVAR